MSSVSTLATGRPSTPTQNEVDLFDDDASRERIIVVKVAGRLLAIPVSNVREVHKNPRITKVPGAPPVLRGIANIRGAIVTVLDLAVALSASERNSGKGELTGMKHEMSGAATGSVVLVEHGRSLFGASVDIVQDVSARDEAPMAPTAVAAALHADTFHDAPLAGVVRADGADVPLLDVAALCSQYLTLTE